jgi:hypothetical protein
VYSSRQYTIVPRLRKKTAHVEPDRPRGQQHLDQGMQRPRLQPRPRVRAADQEHDQHAQQHRDGAHDRLGHAPQQRQQRAVAVDAAEDDEQRPRQGDHAGEHHQLVDQAGTEQRLVGRDALGGGGPVPVHDQPALDEEQRQERGHDDRQVQEPCEPGVAI